MTKVYDYHCYRSFIKTAVEEKKQVLPSLTFAKIAEYAGMQKSYISQVLNGKGTLNSDQLFLIGKKLRLGPKEMGYLNLLLEFEKCQIPERKKQLELEIARLREEHCNTSNYIEYDTIDVIENEAFAQYYNDPYCSLIHIFLSLPEYSMSLTKITNRLQISNEKVADVVETLEKCGIIRLEKGSMRLVKSSLHLDGKSFLSRTQASMFRLKAIEHHQKSKNNEDYFYTASFSTSEVVRKEIKKRYLEFVSDISRLIKEEEADDVFHINFDLFKV